MNDADLTQHTLARLRAALDAAPAVLPRETVRDCMKLALMLEAHAHREQDPGPVYVHVRERE